MYCTNCGGPNPEGSSFCNKCGSNLVQPQVVPPQAQTAAPARKTNGFAVAALVLGIAGFIIPLSALLAIIFGALSLSQIRKEPTLEGKGMALAGLICGSIALFIWICVIILGILLFIPVSTTTSNFSVWALTISSMI